MRGLFGARRSRSRWLLWSAGGTLGVLASLAVAFGLLAAQLKNGPIRIDSVGQGIATSLKARTGGGYRFDIGPTFLAHSDHGPALVVDNFKVWSGDQPVIEAPRAEVSIDPLALLGGDMRPRRLQISDLDLKLVVLPDGSISIASGQSTPIPVSAAPAPLPQSDAPNGRIPRAALLAKAGTALRNFFDLATQPGGAIGIVERIGIKSGRLIVEDTTAERRTVFEDLNVEFEKDRSGTDLTIRARGPNGPLSLEAHAQGAPGELRTLSIAVKDISIDEMILASGVRHPLFDSDVKLEASARFALDPNGRVREANASFGLGAGYVRLEDPDHEPFFLDEFTGSAHWDVNGRRLVLDPTNLFAAETRLSLVGTVDPPAAGEEGWKVALRLAEPGTLSPERPGERNLAIAELGVEGTVLPFAQRATLSRGVLKGADIDVSLTGVTDWTRGLRIQFAGQAGQGPLRALMRVWPSHVASNIRAWLIGHTHGGVVRSGTMSANYDQHSLLMMRYNRPPPDNTLQMDFTIANGSVETLAGLPPITGLDATVHVTGRTLQLKAKGGTLEAAGGRRLTLLDGQLDMPKNDGSDIVPAKLTIRGSGAAEAVVDLLSKDAFKSVGQMPIDPGSVRGKIEGRVAVDFEVGPLAQSSRATVDANLTATDVSVDRLIGKERLEGATFAINSDNGGFKATGSGRLFGGPATFEIRKSTNQSAATALANLTLDEAARARAGYGLQGVTGPIGARINATLGGDGTKAQVDLDLTRAGIENGIPGLVKPAGKPARLAFTIDGKGSTLLLEQLSFEGGGAIAKGAVELTPDGGFQSARFSQMRLSAGDDFKADILKGPDGMKVSLRAANFDARPFLKLLTQPGGASAAAPGTGGDFDLELKAPIITGFGKQVLSNVDLRLVRKASTIRLFTMNGSFGRKPVVVSMARDGIAPQVTITTPDAGALLAFTDIYGRMDGGALSALLQLESGRVTGSVQVQNFVLRDEPALRRLVMEGVPQQAANSNKPQLKSDSIQVQFDRLQVVFTQAGGRLDIRDGVMNGQTLGLTVEGSIDDRNEALNLNGTYVPAYGINNLFSKIPLFGVFLGGDWNEGLFAVNYRITGKPASPVLSINPLSMAPGLLRKVFGALDGQGQSQTAFPAPQLPPVARGVGQKGRQLFDPAQVPATTFDPSGR